MRQLRSDRGLSQEQLAQLSDFHRTYIADVERGARNPSYLNLERLAAALGVGIMDLINTNPLQAPAPATTNPDSA